MKKKQTLKSRDSYQIKSREIAKKIKKINQHNILTKKKLKKSQTINPKRTRRSLMIDSPP
jgi:hypothetical protein